MEFPRNLRHFQPLITYHRNSHYLCTTPYFQTFITHLKPPKPSTETSEPVTSPATPSSSTSTSPLDRWFKHDLPALRASHRDTSIQSWYSQLSSVANSVLLQCILIYVGVTPKDHGGRRREYNTAHVRQVLERVPTQPRTDGHVPFDIAERSIDEWVRHLNRLEDGVQSPGSSVSTMSQEDGRTGSVGSQDRVVEEWGVQKNRSENVMASPSPSPSPSTSPVSERNTLLNQLEAWCEQNAHDQESSEEHIRETPVPRRGIASSLRVPPSSMNSSSPPMRNHLESATGVSMTPSNDSDSQLYERLHQVQVGKELVRLVYQEYMERLAVEKGKLVKTARAVLEAQRVLDTVIGDTRGVSEEVRKLLELGGR